MVDPFQIFLRVKFHTEIVLQKKHTVKLLEFLPTQIIDIVLLLLHILVLQEYWVLRESILPFELVLSGMRVVHFP